MSCPICCVVWAVLFTSHVSSSADWHQAVGHWPAEFPDHYDEKRRDQAFPVHGLPPQVQLGSLPRALNPGSSRSLWLLSSQHSFLPVATWGRPQQTSRCFGGGDVFLHTSSIMNPGCRAKSDPSICSSMWTARNILLSDVTHPIRWFTSCLCSLSPSDSLWRLWLHYSSGRHRRHILHHQRRAGEEEGWRRSERLSKRWKRSDLAEVIIGLKSAAALKSIWSSSFAPVPLSLWVISCVFYELWALFRDSF